MTDSSSTSSSASSTYPITESKQNSKALICEKCSTKIILSGVGELVQHELVRLPYPDKQKNETESVSTFWLVKGQRKFENIGVSHAVTGPNVKYLCCSYCDWGPIGIQFLSNSSHFYLAANRVKCADESQARAIPVFNSGDSGLGQFIQMLAQKQQQQQRERKTNSIERKRLPVLTIPASSSSSSSSAASLSSSSSSSSSSASSASSPISVSSSLSSTSPSTSSSSSAELKKKKKKKKNNKKKKAAAQKQQISPSTSTASSSSSSLSSASISSASSSASM
eukprot:TRINITY_DN329_c0_g4_i1.p1 TRINITY_DN329_c0_g4~~TRINITY_DN329_c0_g4_i1.p1  ORF type:complete len:294 (+),score=137.95 TRINITY_DN329_c0_g4_i1:43-882(+)